MTRISLFDIKEFFKDNDKEITSVVLKILKEANYILGDNVRRFEDEFCRYLRIKYAVGVASGTDALLLALKALNIRKDDEIIIPNNCYPTAFPVADVARPKFVDIDHETLNIDLNKIERAITKKTKAILPIHLYGLMVNMEEIMKIARKHKILVIEDACQAHGARLGGKMAGTFADVSCFSFYPTKNLGGFGDGGMVVTNNKKIADTVRQLRMYGEKQRYQSVRIGTVSRLDEIQAGILRIKLKQLEDNNQKRIENAKKYFSYLNQSRLILPPARFDNDHVYYLFTVRTEKRNELKDYLNKAGVDSTIHTPTPMHLVKPFGFLNHRLGDFPVCEKAARETLSLPCHPHLTDLQIKSICNLINNAIK